ncbi:MAG: sulfur carrier protein ThiS [Elusimicrobia bacterium]|nr:sulfur carrier protein ThiS [Elusimicrobiota bacterium]
MTLTVNGEPRQGAEGLTLAQLVEDLHLVPGRLACEVNGNIVRRADYATTRLADGDTVEIVQMIGGG